MPDAAALVFLCELTRRDGAADDVVDPRAVKRAMLRQRSGQGIDDIGMAAQDCACFGTASSDECVLRLGQREDQRGELTFLFAVIACGHASPNSNFSASLPAVSSTTRANTC